MNNINNDSGRIINKDDLVTVTQMGHITEVQYLEHRNLHAAIRKINADEYVVLATGEVKQFAKSENRADNKNSLRQTFKKLRYLINNNFTGQSNELFITLTYAENMTDHRQLGKDFKNFMHRLQTKLKNKNIEYIRVSEPQGRGAWHLHVLLKGVPFLENEMLRKIWGHGFVRINKIQGVDNIGSYLTAYLSDMPLDEFTGGADKNLDVVEKLTETGTKKIVKGGRLHLYPSGMNYYAKSKGMKYPERKNMRYYKLFKGTKKDNLGKLSFEKNIEFTTSDGFTNFIRYEQYNTKR